MATCFQAEKWTEKCAKGHEKGQFLIHITFKTYFSKKVKYVLDGNVLFLDD